MAKQQDKEKIEKPSAPSPSAADGAAGGAVPDKADVYDPVGMAGKKAGIVEELEQRQDDAASGEAPSSPKALPPDR
jgi:hypothetical protein